MQPLRTQVRRGCVSAAAIGTLPELCIAGLFGVRSDRAMTFSACTTSRFAIASSLAMAEAATVVTLYGAILKREDSMADMSQKDVVRQLITTES